VGGEGEGDGDGEVSVGGGVGWRCDWTWDLGGGGGGLRRFYGAGLAWIWSLLQGTYIRRAMKEDTLDR